MKTIWKFPLKVVGLQNVEMPIGAEILTVQTQGQGHDRLEQPFIWAIVDSYEMTELRHFEIYGTGHKLGEIMTDKKYIGTFQQTGFVWHLFEVKQKEGT